MANTSEYDHVGKRIVCPICDELFLPLGFMRHRAAHRERKAEIKKLREILDSGRYDSADLKRYELLIKREGGSNVK